ncbi:polysaccharide biosynthesis protein [Lichenicoccus sp.]|uniref:polysaccharide biosynthesis protein n=1 Tax=Lichenicoccus sp. TaxID=2781899 RepID=UPI003D1018AD
MRSINRILVNMALDGALAAAAAPIARYLADPHGGLIHPLWFLAGGAITLLVGGAPFRMPQQYWRFSGVADLLSIAGGSVLSAALFALLFHVTGFPLPSVTFPVIHAMVLLLMLGGLRIVYRLSQAKRVRLSAEAVQPVLLIGADEPADLFLRAIGRDRSSPLRILGLLALGGHQAGRRIRGHSILGTVRDAGLVLDRLAAAGRAPRALVVTEPDFRGENLAALIEAADARGIAVRRAPNPTTLAPAARVELRPVAIEELLNRPQVPLDRDGMAGLVRGRRVLVTGAGGSIGSELARQVASLDPEQLVLVDHGEFALWQIDLELGETMPHVKRAAVIADTRDVLRIDRVFQSYRPELVFHAAALKHVPMVELNPNEGLLTNIVGTRQVADAAARAGARAMVLISTDKAVNPSSLMGASKRAAEMYCQALDIRARHLEQDRGDLESEAAGTMRCVTVRFGNVLGSNGSVVPLFRRQLERGGPLTVTHPDMQRYFMTVPEAVGLVLQASVLGIARSGVGPTLGDSTLGDSTASRLRDGGIFVLDMGRLVKIVDLARQMIRLAGLRPDEDVAIRYTGLRPGEKLIEELFHGHEPPVPTSHPGLLMATPRTADLLAVGGTIDAIAAACRGGDTAAAISLLHALVPEFAHNHDGALPGPAAAPVLAALPVSRAERTA